MSILSAYANAAVNTAKRIQDRIEEIELYVEAPIGLARLRAQVLSDSCELQELANRLYSLLYRRGETLPEQMDPLTMRFRELGESNQGEPGMAPRMETPAQKIPEGS